MVKMMIRTIKIENQDFKLIKITDIGHLVQDQVKQTSKQFDKKQTDFLL